MTARPAPPAWLLLTALLLLVAPRVYAYLDPGSGSMFVQLLLGGVTGLWLLCRLYWRRMLTRLGLKKPPEHDEPPA